MQTRAAAAVVLVRLVLVVQPAPLDRCSLKLLREHLPAAVEAQRLARLVWALLGLVAQLAPRDLYIPKSLRARRQGAVGP